MYKQLILLTLLATVISANLYGWRNCGSHLAYVRYMRIDGCLQTPCTFVRGREYLLEVEATSHTNSNTLPFAATVPFLGLNVTLFTGNACEHLSDGSCPAQIGHDFTFSMLYAMPTNLPPLQSTVTTTLWNDFGEVGVCVQVDVILA